MRGESKMKKKAEYKTLNKFELHAAILLLATMIFSFIYADSGIIFVIYSLPTSYWSGLIPGVFGITILLRLLIRYETVEIEASHEEIYIKTRGIRKHSFSVERSEIICAKIGFYDTQPLRSIALGVLLFFNIEVHYMNGLDLLGETDAATLLLISGVLTSIGLISLSLGRNKALEIYTESSKVTLLVKNDKEIIDQLKMIIFSDDVPNEREKPSLRLMLKSLLHNMKDFIAETIVCAAILIIILFYTFSPAFYFGQFTPYIGFGMFIYYVYRICEGKYIKNSAEPLYEARGLFTSYLYIKNYKSKQEDHRVLAKFDVFEIICWLYIIAQCVKYGFRFIWIPSSPLIWYQMILSYVILGASFALFIKRKEKLVLKIGNRLIIYCLKRSCRLENNNSGDSTAKDPTALGLWLILVLIPAIYYILGEFMLFS